VLLYMKDPTEALRHVAQRVRPGGIVAFHECALSVTAASENSQPALRALLALLGSVFKRSGAHLDIGVELYSRMRDAGLEPDPAPLAEFVVRPPDDPLAHRRWALFARSLLPKIVAYGLDTDDRVRLTVEQDLRQELLTTGSLVPLSWLMVGQWARVPASSL
jgi:hypothetical protein